MKRILAFALVFVCVFSLAACGSGKTTETTAPATSAPTTTETTAPETTAPETTEAAPVVMSYAEYVAAELDSEVVIETYVQDHQSWWDNKITCYTQDEDGAYFLYNMACSQEDAEKLVPGTKIRVTGYKSEWSGEVEIVDASFEILEGSFVAEPVDVTDTLADEEALIALQNRFVSFKGMTVEASKNADGEEVAFLYNWDGSGSHDDNSDLYFNVSVNGTTYNFCVESYLRNNSTDVYAAVEALQIGDTIDMEGFLYWYNGVNPHITAVTVH